MRRAPVPLRHQAGNGLLFALLGLVVSGTVAVSTVQNLRLQARQQAGNAEAGILDDLRNAANNAIFEFMGVIQNGQALSKNGVTVAPVQVNGEAVWQPTISDLVGMGYLPPGWSATRSSLNQAAYTVSFQRVPSGCIVAACNIEGHVLLNGPLRGGSAPVDGAVVGAILTRIGADAGVSLLTGPAQITGFGNTWALPNPVAGQPAGVVAIRIGTASSAYGQFVRIGDNRDPDLAGNLTVAGNTLFGSGATTSEFRSAVHVDGQALTVMGATGSTCLELRPDGSLLVHCAGLVDAATGVFADGSGQSVAVGAGAVTASAGFHTPAIDAFAAGDPQAIVVKAGDLLVRDGSGHVLLDVGPAGDLWAAGLVQGRRLVLSDTVQEGDACQGPQVAFLAQGGLATCQQSRFQATTRYATLGAACSTAGQEATDSGSGDTLVCRGGSFASLSGLLSSRVYMASFAVAHGSFVAAAQALPNGCPATAGQIPPQAAIYLLPQSDANSVGNPVLNRDAQWTGSGWTVALTDGAGAPTQSLAIAEVYCVYP